MELPRDVYKEASDNTDIDPGKSVKVTIERDGEFKVKAS